MPGGALPAVSAAADADVQIERVVGPEIPGKYKHPASIEELANGDLYIAYYGGDGEYAEQTAVYGMRRKKGESRWSTPKIIADTPFHSDGNAVVCRRRMGWCGCSMWCASAIRGAHRGSRPSCRMTGPRPGATRSWWR